MRIFLSYASEDRDTANEIYLVLYKAGHKVFFDRTLLQGGDDFHTRIQKNINKCELLIFLISPDSLAKSSYALTELKFAEEKWPHPCGHLLPVMVRETSHDLISPYLKAVSFLEPKGNTAAEVGKQILGWKKRHGYTRTRAFAFILSGLLVGSIIAFILWSNWNDRETSRSETPYSSPQNNHNDSPPSSPAANNAAAAPAAPSTSKNIGRSQTQTPSQPTISANSNQVAAVEPKPVPFSLTSRVFDGERPVKGAKVSIVGEPEQGVVETNNDGIFTLKVVHKQLNDSVTLRVEYAGFVVWQRNITLGEQPPQINLERKK